MTKELFPSHQFQWEIIRQMSQRFFGSSSHKVQTICSYLESGKGQGACKTTPLLISMSILRDLPQQKKKNPSVLCPHLPQFYMFPRSHGNGSFLRIGKEARKFKRVFVCVMGRFLYSCVLLRFGNTLRFMPLGAPPSLRKQSRVFFFLSFVQFCDDVGYS